MKKTLLPLATLFLCTTVLATDSIFEEGNKHGLLLGATIVPQTMVSISVGQCVKRFPELRKKGEDIKNKWENRNLKHVNKARYLAKQINLKIANVIGQKEAEEITTNTISTIKNQASNAAKKMILKTLDAAPQKQRKTLCLNIFTVINQGKMDMETNQPAAYRLIKNAN